MSTITWLANLGRRRAAAAAAPELPLDPLSPEARECLRLMAQASMTLPPPSFAEVADEWGKLVYWLLSNQAEQYERRLAVREWTVAALGTLLLLQSLAYFALVRP